uniref:non-specific serine/threonine protein kinase n=1 Tax=Aegilops tauschii TaxID=37682 RepID=M8AP60_AEGTA
MAVVLLLLRLSILLMPLPSAAATAQLCGSGGNYTANSTYQSNLAVVAATLPNKASSSSQLFATATAGQVTDVVYALALCRGDTVNATACRDCVAASFQEAQRSCPYYLGATVYYDDGEQQQQQTARRICPLTTAWRASSGSSAWSTPPRRCAWEGRSSCCAATSGHGIKPWVIAISVAAPVALVAFCFIVCYPRLRRRYMKGQVRLREKRHTHELQGGDEHVWEMEAEFSEFSIFEFHQILEATNNFSEENKLGKGGFGPVYKGHFPDGIEIAVKRLDSHSGQDNNRKVLIDLNKRLEIIEGIAEGLLYLHMHSRLCVIHRDLKPSNILLDNEMNPKISDFGLAKIFSSNAEGIITRRVAGTYGYMAPEYASQGIFSIKSDVFSFGVLTLEILSGKRNSGSHQCGDFIYLLGYIDP